MALLLNFVVAFATALALVPICRLVARRYGLVATPRADRWHGRPTALLGGVGGAAGVGLPEALVFAAVFGELQELVIGNKHSHWWTFGRMLKTHGDKAIQVGASKSKSAFGGAFDFDMVQDRQGGF